MQLVLSDHNCEGHARAIFAQLEKEGYLDMMPLALGSFLEVGLSHSADDEIVWRVCQARGYLLLTGNRTADDGIDSLELTIRRLVMPDSLPVLTIGNLGRVLADPDYCLACAERLAEIVLDLPLYRGVTRLYIP